MLNRQGLMTSLLLLAAGGLIGPDEPVRRLDLVRPYGKSQRDRQLARRERRLAKRAQRKRYQAMAQAS